MKRHVSACNGHRQVSTTIKKTLFNRCRNLTVAITGRNMLMWRSLHQHALTQIYRRFLIIVET